MCVVHTHISNLCMCTLIPKPINDVHCKENKQVGMFVKVSLANASDEEYLPKFTSSKHSSHMVAYYNNGNR